MSAPWKCAFSSDIAYFDYITYTKTYPRTFVFKFLAVVVSRYNMKKC